MSQLVNFMSGIILVSDYERTEIVFLSFPIENRNIKELQIASNLATLELYLQHEFSRVYGFDSFVRKRY